MPSVGIGGRTLRSFTVSGNGIGPRKRNGWRKTWAPAILLLLESSFSFPQNEKP